jgi:F-type H+-transporting ATPase subunit delta
VAKIAIRGYAHALFSIAEAEDALETVEDELFRFARALESESELRDSLTDPALPVDRKEAVIHDILGERASRHTISILDFLLEQGKARELAAIVDELVALAAERRKAAVAEVRTAVPLDDKTKERLAKALEHATGKKVELRVVIDQSVVGGVVARVGDQVIDGSIRKRLELARDRMSKVQ